MGSSALDQLLVAKSPKCRVRNRAALLHTVERQNVFERQGAALHEELGVSLVDNASENSKLHFLRIGEVVIREREVAVRLGAVHSLDSVPKMVNHVQLGHGLHQRGIPVMARHMAREGVFIGIPFEKCSDAGELELVRVLDDADSRILGVVLVGNAVVDGLQDASLVVFLHLALDELVGRKEAYLDVPDTRVQLGGGEDKGGS